MLGVRGVDVLSWESFSKGWATDITQHLRLEDVRVFDADFGQLPDLSQVDCDRDVVFAWNGTTSGVKVLDGEWIAADRAGLNHLRRHIRDLRRGSTVGKARRSNLLLAKGHGRRGRARNAHPESTGG